MFSKQSFYKNKCSDDVMELACTDDHGNLGAEVKNEMNL